MRSQHALVDASFLALRLLEGCLAQRVRIVGGAARLHETLVDLVNAVGLLNLALLPQAAWHLIEPGRALRMPSLVECLAFMLALYAAMKLVC